MRVLRREVARVEGSPLREPVSRVPARLDRFGFHSGAIGPGVAGMGTGPVLPARVAASWSARAQELAASARAAGEGLGAQIAALLAAPEARGAKISLSVIDLDAPSTPLAAAGAETALNPASNAKLATACFALGVLGAEHRFETIVSRDARGNIYLRGGFDFSLQPEDLAAIAGALGPITGEVVLDNSALEGSRVPPGFEKYGDQDWAYLARVEALSVSKNLVELTVLPGRPGEPPRIISDSGAFELRNRASTSAPKSEFKLACDEIDGQPIIEVWGEIAADYKKGKKLIMKSPDPVAGFADALRSAGVNAKIREGVTPPGAETIYIHRSRPLGELLQESIATSNAFDHEMIALAAARERAGTRSISIDRAMRELESFARDELGLRSIVMKNASGIGNLDLLSAADLVSLLARHRELSAALARPGQPGTLQTRMLDTPAERVLCAKTGTGEGAVALSGLIESDRPLAFSFLINDAPAGRAASRALADALGTLLAEVRRAR